MTDGLPREWTRGPQWVSPAAMAEWAPVLSAARAAWVELEILSVSAEVRDSALLHLTPDELVQATRAAGGQGLLVVPLARDGDKVRSALTRPRLFGTWLHAWAMGDDEVIGDLLGFPTCCRTHFARTWGRGMTDTVVNMQGVDAVLGRGRTADGPPEANLLLRHLGVRLVPHLPCSVSCESTVALGRSIAETGRRGGVDVDSIYRLLELPATYSALNGVAITETPHFRFMSGTDVAEARVSRAAVMPEERRPDGPPRPAEPTTWEDNGFATQAAMVRAHYVVLRAVMDGNVTISSALDLGCGDGRLLDRIRQSSPLPEMGRLAWCGVEVDEGRVERGRARHPEVIVEQRTIQSLAHSETRAPFSVRRPDVMMKGTVALLMPGRLLEMAPGEAELVRKMLQKIARRLVVYTYGDQGGLLDLCERVGLRVVGHLYSARPYEAASEAVVA